jgi:hypothetical protein
MGEIPSSFRQLCVGKYGFPSTCADSDFIGGWVSPYYIKILLTDLNEVIRDFSKTI